MMKKLLFLFIFDLLLINCNSKPEKENTKINPEISTSGITSETQEMVDSTQTDSSTENQIQIENQESPTHEKTSDQEEFTAYLNNGLDALHNQNVEEFETKLKYFSTAIKKTSSN